MALWGVIVIRMGNRWIIALPRSYNTPYEKIGDEVRSLADYAPFEIPETWEWCRVGDLFTNMSGLAYKKEVLDIKSDRMIRVMRGGNIGDEKYYFKADDVFISDEFVKPELFLKKNYMITPAVSSLEHIGKIALIEEDLIDTVVGGFVLMLIPLFNDDIISKYLLYAFAAKNHRDNCRSITHKSGQAFYNLSRELMMNLPIPLPPRSEMVRIILKLEEVLPFVDSYSNAERESTALNTSFPEQLKKSILQWAVQGKLVPQDPTDEPAEALLERIRGEKERLVREGKIKKDKHESVIFRRDNSHYEKRGSETVCIDEEIPFEIPQNWRWVRYSSIALFENGDRSSKYPVDTDYTTDGIPFFGAKDMGDRYMNFDEVRFISKKKFDELGNGKLADGDFICLLRGSVGKTRIFRKNDKYSTGFICAQMLIIRSLLPEITDYIYAVMDSPYYTRWVESKVTGTAVRQLPAKEISNILLPIPPLAEQIRITTVISDLLDFCSKL